MLLIELVQDAPITDASAKRSIKTVEEFNVAPQRVLAHFRKCAVDIAQLGSRKPAELPLGATSDRQAPFHASTL